MIVDFFIKMLNGLISLIPDFSSFNWLSYSLDKLFEYLSIANYYIPVTELFALIGVFLAYYSARGVFFIIKWVASRLVI